ncbi:MAG TPA: DNA polymerase III subunit gamma/tau [Acidimicrobiales bacterium]|nr:DNA polymerase III subunit gamma/tau [Acidimicrobiales bacterium]
MSAPNYQSLYRRYRPQRFDQVLGQDHVTKALRNAVREGRVGHAYLFSGPRGTGKTSAARILAKVLNCADPQDGEPCGKCDNCLAVERGQLTDWFLEQDAASKSKVDDMRDLLDRVPLGTSGNRKVIILDEVHMLSQGAENALLKTLEEPPDHVVFVLATTDPQKVRPTIRSRTQHFGFHLLPPDVLEQHIRHVIADADLGLADDAVTHVLRAGGGSARDTLSALDQVSALGEVVSDGAPVDAILEALAAHDVGAVLVAVAEATSTGREPRALGEAVIVRLRDAFLAVLGAGDEQLQESERARARELGQQIGAAGLTRALEVLGEALMELSRKPDPRVVVEVALVRLARPDADRSLDAVLERLDRLERAIQSGTVPPAPSGAAAAEPTATAPTATAPATQAAVPTPPPATNGPSGSGGPTSGGGGPASAARAALAEKLASKDKPGRAAPKAAAPATDTTTAPPPTAATSTEPTATTPPPTAATDTEPAATAAPETAAASTGTAATAAAPTPAASTAPAATTPPPTVATDTVATAPAAAPVTAAAAPDPVTNGGGVDLAGLTKIWSEVLAELPLPVRSKWRGGSWVTPLTNPAQFAVPNAWHQKACDEGRRDVEQALAARLGEGMTVEVVLEGGEAAASPAPAGGQAPAPTAPPEDDDVESIDVSELRDADNTPAGGVDLLLREFGGGQLIEEDNNP